MPTRWTTHIQNTRKEGETYKAAMMRASKTYKKEEKPNKTPKVKTLKVKDLKKKPIDKPRKKKVVEAVEEISSD